MTIVPPLLIIQIPMEKDEDKKNPGQPGHLIKACVNCRHLEVLEEGQEVSGLEDTAFLRTRCRILDKTFTDHYAFPTGEDKLVIDEKPGECPFWEPWDEEQDKGRIQMSDNVLEKIRIDAEELIAELMKEYYMHMSGQKDALDIGPIFGKYKHLFSGRIYSSIC